MRRQKKESETFKIKLQIDPGTMANLYIHGELDNQQCCLQLLVLVCFEKGGFEIFA